MNSRKQRKFFKDNILIYYTAIFKYALGMTKHKESAEDIAQYTLEKAWKSLEQLREKEKAKSWVFSIAHNEINKYFRELGKQNMEEPLEIDRKEYIDNSINPEYLCIEKIKNKEELLILAKAMEELPGKYREVLVLWSQGKLTEKEIAVVLDMNYSTVRVMVHRGLEKLRKLYFDIERRERDEAR